MHTFKEYTSDDAIEVGKSFVTTLRDRRDELNALRIPTPEWTHFILDWFSSTAPADVRVDATGYPARRGRGQCDIHESLRRIAGTPRKTTCEFMFDLCHSTWSLDEPRRSWIEDLEKAPIMKLALESEMGKASNGAANLNAIMDDASKLLHVCARVKVVVFASVPPPARAAKSNNRRQILDVAEKMVQADRTGIGGEVPTWLWIDVPWALWKDEVQPDAWVSDRSDAGQIMLNTHRSILSLTRA